MNTKYLVKTVKNTALWVIVARLSSLMKMSMVLGSYAALFSASNVFAPLAGAFGGTATCFGMFGVSMIIRLLFFKVISFKFLAFYVPGLCASLYWAQPIALVRLVLPLACMALFVVHPVGGAAFLYAALWLVPVGLYFTSQKNSFFTALGSTLTAHAVGSVIWLYAAPTTAAFWLALIPVAVVERLCFASCMALAHHVICFFINSKQVIRFAYYLFIRNKVKSYDR